MPYNNLIQRGDVAARVPETISNQMLTNLSASSAALTLGTRINVPTGRTRFPVLSAMPVAYWVTGDTGLKKTSTAAWDRKFIDIEELAVIVPLPDAVQEDVDFDIWGEIQPMMETAISRTLDAAVLFGVDKPAALPADLVAQANAVGNVVVLGTASTPEGGYAADISDLLAKVEDSGYIADGALGRTDLRGVIRRLNTGTIEARPGAVLTPNDWFGVPVSYPALGLWPDPSVAGNARALVGSFKDNLVVGVRRDFTYKLFTEGVITDEAGAVIYNLMQQDMSAMRLTFRAGFQVANPINYLQPDESLRSPFAVLKAA